MPISGVVISCKNGTADELAQSITQPDSIEVHGVLPDGSLVAVIEADSVEAEMEIIEGLLRIDGIIDVRLAYHNFEDLAMLRGQ